MSICNATMPLPPGGLEADCHIDMKRGPATDGGIARSWGTACDQEIDFTEHSF